MWVERVCVGGEGVCEERVCVCEESVLGGECVRRREGYEENVEINSNIRRLCKPLWDMIKGQFHSSVQCPVASIPASVSGLLQALW